ncbi:YidH family protein [Paenibacillus sp. MAH-36]|uniref:DUF202 domain-containing protein n=1 Tax=Paenibacillus violae TaxID=3077234 RepID=A0ABU3RM71_9BACL|nr:DUF202 domain-containing protein [Paenibacillus sp. PFR10]MDU0205380.1 DUF202 domain-containing protein [Paenibacillus sp. PFR10]
MEAGSSHESKLVQQHLANERTFLAWVRTGIATIGLGFLATGIVFRANLYSYCIHKIAAIVGINGKFLQYTSPRGKVYNTVAAAIKSINDDPGSFMYTTIWSRVAEADTIWFRKMRSNLASPRSDF